MLLIDALDIPSPSAGTTSDSKRKREESSSQVEKKTNISFLADLLKQPDMIPQPIQSLDWPSRYPVRRKQ
jgi:hypothetical protein